MRLELRRDSQAALFVRSALTDVILVEVWIFGGCGSMTSVNVIVVMFGSDCSKAVARA